MSLLLLDAALPTSPASSEAPLLGFLTTQWFLPSWSLLLPPHSLSVKPFSSHLANSCHSSSIASSDGPLLSPRGPPIPLWSNWSTRQCYDIFGTELFPQETTQSYLSSEKINKYIPVDTAPSSGRIPNWNPPVGPQRGIETSPASEEKE